MNNRFKFRLWNKNAKIFMQEGDGKFAEITLLNGLWNSYSNLDEYIIQQCTGMKDIKGNLVYEGDIIQLEGAPYYYEVVWNKWYWGIDSKGVVADFIQSYTIAIEERAIVVGNILENLELIKKL